MTKRKHWDWTFEKALDRLLLIRGIEKHWHDQLHDVQASRAESKRAKREEYRNKWTELDIEVRRLRDELIEWVQQNPRPTEEEGDLS